MEIRVRAPQGQFLLDRLLGGEERLTVEIRGYELATLDALAGRVARVIVDVPGITDIETSLEAGLPQQEIRVNRDKVADIGLSVRDVTQLLQTAVAGSKAGEYRSGGNSYRILVQLQDAEKRSLDEILNLTLTTGSGDSDRPQGPATSSDGPRQCRRPRSGFRGIRGAGAVGSDSASRRL
jgi:HAE1 family hydrophobic/amphiphilic exporter-1